MRSLASLLPGLTPPLGDVGIQGLSHHLTHAALLTSSLLLEGELFQGRMLVAVDFKRHPSQVPYGRAYGRTGFFSGRSSFIRLLGTAWQLFVGTAGLFLTGLLMLSPTTSEEGAL